MLVDGNDVEAVFEASRVAAERARAGNGPTLVECRTLRMHGHGAHDDMSYVPEALKQEWSGRDPIELYSERLVADHGFDADEVERIRSEVKAYVDECAQKALASPMPDPAIATEGVFADDITPLGDGQAPWSLLGERRRREERRLMAEMTYLEAISDGLREEMRRDDSVFCMGQDIGNFGGAFKVTDGFMDEFGSQRVLDAPLAENAIIGTAVGAAVEGLRPVCEMQFADFISCGFDQLVNVAAKLHYRQGVAAPIVVRLPSGGGFSGGPFHSQNPEAWFLQSPGPAGGRPGDRRRRQGPADRGDPRPEPGLLPRAQGALPLRQGRGPRGRVLGRARQGAGRPRGRGDERDHLRLGGPPRARGGRGARRVDRGASTCAPCARWTPRRSWRPPARRARCSSPTRRRNRAG